MNVLFYIPPGLYAVKNICRLVEAVSSSARTIVFQSIDDLSCRLRQPLAGIDIAVLAPCDREDLVNIISIRSLFLDIPLVLILPDRKESTTVMGYSLNPRFLSYLDGDMAVVDAILRKMVENYHKKEGIQEWNHIW